MEILIVTNGGIGDQIQYSSLIAGLKQKHVDSAITVFCHPRQRFIYEYDPNVTNVADNLDEKKKYDLGFNFALRRDLSQIFEEVDIAERKGFRWQDKLVAMCKHSAKLMEIAVNKKHSHLLLSEWFCLIADVEWSRPYFTYKPTKKKYKADIVLQYGTNVEEKDWPKEHYEELLELYSSQEKSIWVTAHTKHKSDVTAFEKRFKCNTLVGEIEELNEVSSLLARAKFLITPDTCVAHIGMAVGAKVIVLSNGYDRGFTLSDKLDNFLCVREERMEDIKPALVEKLVSDLGC